MNEFEGRVTTLLNRMADHAPTRLPSALPAARRGVSSRWRGPLLAGLSALAVVSVIALSRGSDSNEATSALAADPQATDADAAGEINANAGGGNAASSVGGVASGGVSAPLWEAIQSLGVNTALAPAALSDFGDDPFCGIIRREPAAASDSARRCFLDAVAARTPVTMVEHLDGASSTAVVRLRADGAFDHINNWQDTEGDTIVTWSHLVCDGILTDNNNSFPPPPDDPLFFKIHGCGHANRPLDTADQPSQPQQFRDRIALPPCAYVLSVAMTRPIHLECLRAAIAAGQPAEMVVVTGDGAAFTTDWFRHAPGRPDEVWRTTARASDDGEVRSWELLRCGTFEFSDDSVNNWLATTDSCTVDITVDQ